MKNHRQEEEEEEEGTPRAKLPPIPPVQIPASASPMRPMSEHLEARSHGVWPVFGWVFELFFFVLAQFGGLGENTRERREGEEAKKKFTSSPFSISMALYRLAGTSS